MNNAMQKMAAHLTWADSNVLRALREAPGSDGRALAIFGHVVAAEAVWLARIAGRTPDVAVWPTLSLDEAEALARRNADELASVVASASEEDLAGEITYRNSAGAEFRSKLEDILLQVLLHGSYHRGQISLVMRGSGGEPAPTDYIAFVRGAPAARTIPPVPLTQPR